MNTSTTKRDQRSSAALPLRRYGLTLLELLVVLTILIALSGIVVATLPGLLKKTQTATAAANVPEIDAAIKRNQLLNSGSIGNRFDSLVAQSGQIPAYIGGSAMLQAVDVSQADVQALNEIGIFEVIPAAEDLQDVNATFESHAGEPANLGGEAKLCAIEPDTANVLVQSIWNIEPGELDRFILLGIGQQCSLVGAGTEAIFSEAPLHFSDSNLSNPEAMYSRYILVVRLRREQPSTDDQPSRVEAQYLGVVIPSLQGIEGMASQLQQYYSDQ